eukprot:1155679_1
MTPFSEFILLCAFIQLFPRINSQYTNILFDDMQQNNGWTASSSNDAFFSYSSSNCPQQTLSLCTKIANVDSTRPYIEQSFNISEYSAIRVRFHLSTHDLETGDLCEIYYAYDSISNKQLLQSYTGGNNQGIAYPDQSLDLPLSESSTIVWIWFQGKANRASGSDRCYVNMFYLDGEARDFGYAVWKDNVTNSDGVFTLHRNDRITHISGPGQVTTLIQQELGNLVLYYNGEALWESATDPNQQNPQGDYTQLTMDGILQVIEKGKTTPAWETETTGHGNGKPHTLVVAHRCVYIMDRDANIFWTPSWGHSGLDCSLYGLDLVIHHSTQSRPASTSFLTPIYGGVKTPSHTLDQGRINAISDWGIALGSVTNGAYNNTLYIRDWDADRLNGSAMVMGRNPPQPIGCDSFVLNDNDYIIGYNIYDSSTGSTHVHGITFYTSLGCTYQCFGEANAGIRGGQTIVNHGIVSYYYGANDFWYLSGFIGRFGKIIDTLGLQFSKLPDDVNLTTSNPTHIPTLNPTSDPTSSSTSTTNRPTSLLPSRIPTSLLTLLPSRIGTSSPTPIDVTTVTEPTKGETHTSIVTDHVIHEELPFMRSLLYWIIVGLVVCFVIIGLSSCIYIGGKRKAAIQFVNDMSHMSAIDPTDVIQVIPAPHTIQSPDFITHTLVDEEGEANDNLKTDSDSSQTDGTSTESDYNGMYGQQICSQSTMDITSNHVGEKTVLVSEPQMNQIAQ